MTATIAERVRSVAPRAKRNSERAVADLRALVDELEKADGFYNEALALFQSTLARQNDAEGAVTAALAAQDMNELASALEAREITPEFVQRQMLALNAARNYGAPFNTFLHSHPEAKTLLVAVAKQRFEQARAEADRAFADEQARLGSDYNAEDSPIVKRARAEVGALKISLNRIETEPIEQTFVPFASQLLMNE